MLRQMQCTKRFFLWKDIVNIVDNPICKQSVRWGKKPRWLPIAKTKMFKVPPRPQVPEEEKIEISRLQNNYNTYMKSISVFLHEEMQAAAGQERLESVNEDDDMATAQELNNKWNAEVAKLREQRLLHEKEEAFNLISQKLEESAIREREMVAKIDELVRKEKEMEKYYITPENIDEAIENALRTEVNHNYYIDAKGNIHREDADALSEENATKSQVETRV